jgi:phosphoribosylamine---glycine ligase
MNIRFLILSQGADCVGLCLRLMAEGNEVRVFNRETETENRGKGLIDTTSDLYWGECVIADCTGLGILCDKFKEHGARVACGSSLMDKLETDRKFAEGVMHAAGIRTPKSKSFTDWESAVAFIRAAGDQRLVFKPEGSLSGCVPSYVSHDNEELLESIEHFKTLVGNAKPEFTLQEFIEGTCISTEGWFNGTSFVEPFNQTIERKHFLDGDLGPSGGCTGNLVWISGRENPVVRETILRMEGFLREHDYRGPLDVNAVVNEENAYALEFTPRFGYDAFPTLLYALYEGEMGRLLWDIASGNPVETMEVRDGFGAGVRLSIPPWPNEKHQAESGIPIRGLPQARLVTDFYPYDVELQDDRLMTSGGFGILGVMNAHGETITEAFTECYRKIKRMRVPDLQYRTDMEEVCAKDYRKLSRLVEAFA